MSMNFSDLFGGGGVKPWESGATYAAGKVAMSPADNYQLYVRVVAGAGTTDPSADTTNWKPFGARAIKSIQRGTLTIGHTAASGTATITSVDAAKAQLRHLGNSANSSTSDTISQHARLVLTNGTTITATRGGVSNPLAISYEVVEFY